MKHIRAERSPIGILTLSRIILKNLTYCVLKIQYLGFQTSKKTNETADHEA